MRDYKPQRRTAIIIDAAWDHIQSVPYPVSARWLFYRLLQDGYYKTKEDYKMNFLPLMSRVRHNYYKEWQPDTLMDDNRVASYQDGSAGPTNESDFKSKAVNRVDKIFPPMAHWQDQSYYVEIWFEAAAMRSQFEYYTKGIILRPFGGDPSIPYLYQAACELAGQAQGFGKDAVVLYFGDRDDKGEQIARSARKNAAKWCAVDFHFVRCGLTMEQVNTMGIEENPDKPGTYQWEALTDDQAKAIITQGVAPYIDHEAIEESIKLRERLIAEIMPRLQKAVNKAVLG